MNDMFYAPWWKLWKDKNLSCISNLEEQTRCCWWLDSATYLLPLFQASECYWTSAEEGRKFMIRRMATRDKKTRELHHALYPELCRTFWIREIAPIHLSKMRMDEDVWLKYIVCNGDESHIHGIELCYFNLPLEPGLSLAFSNFSVLSFPKLNQIQNQKYHFNLWKIS